MFPFRWMNNSAFVRHPNGYSPFQLVVRVGPNRLRWSGVITAKIGMSVGRCYWYWFNPPSIHSFSQLFSCSFTRLLLIISKCIDQHQYQHEHEHQHQHQHQHQQPQPQPTITKQKNRRGNELSMIAALNLHMLSLHVEDGGGEVGSKFESFL